MSMGNIGKEKVTPETLGKRIYEFSLRALRLVNALPKRQVASKVLGEQLLRSATSIAANYEEARGAVSRADFIAKLGIAYKESREVYLWLSMIADVKLLPENRMKSIIAEAEEIRAILGSSLKTARLKKGK